MQQLGSEFEAPSVCLLVAIVHHHQVQPLEPVVKWCVENGFELIEWTPGESGKDKASGRSSLLEDDAVSGTARLVEALEAHVWPDITMKSAGTKHAPKRLATADEKPATILLSENDKLLAEGLNGEKDEGDESFEELFAKFAEMKGNNIFVHALQPSSCCHCYSTCSTATT